MDIETSGAFSDVVTGRQLYCDGCRKPLDRPTHGQLSISCRNCGTLRTLDSPLSQGDSSGFTDAISEDVTSRQRLDHGSSAFLTPTHLPMDEDEFTMQPCVDRPSPVPASIAVLASGLVADSTVEAKELPYRNLSSPSQAVNTRGMSAPTAAAVPTRHYPTLESIQRLYRVFGYVNVLVTFPYLFGRLILIILNEKNNLLAELMAYTEYALPILLISVVVTGTLFAAAEAIQLAIDIQDNTHRMALESRRRQS